MIIDGPIVEFAGLNRNKSDGPARPLATSSCTQEEAQSHLLPASFKRSFLSAIVRFTSP
jgi:hypothetical protein